MSPRQLFPAGTAAWCVGCGARGEEAGSMLTCASCGLVASPRRAEAPASPAGQLEAFIARETRELKSRSR